MKKWAHRIRGRGSDTLELMMAVVYNDWSVWFRNFEVSGFSPSFLLTAVYNMRRYKERNWMYLLW